MEDLSQADVPPELSHLQEECRRRETDEMKANLVTFQYHIDDEAAVTAIIGDTRIELVCPISLSLTPIRSHKCLQHVMGLFYLLLSQLHCVLQDPVSDSAVRRSDLSRIENLATSCMVVYMTLEKRMHNLMWGWHSQGCDIDLQLGRFANGLFSDIQHEVWPLHYGSC